ncbi:MAG TPA: efflux transporter outer membrane subunit [Steroidobacteraceae bacterium]|nr:efflux transporter outer membrane subunit [Steroidobacteraceae bacterium]
MSGAPSLLSRRRAPPAAAVGTGVSLLMGIAGCTLEPTYHRPEARVSQQWPGSPAVAVTPSAAAGKSTATPAATADIGWREFFVDARLQRLIELALQHNPDAQIAALNIAAARAQYQIQRADLFPSVAASATEQVDKYPPAVAGIAAAGGSSTGALRGSGSGTFRYFEVGVGFTSYELDLFGRIRSLNHQRLQQYFGYVETRRSVRISLVAEVANAYLTLLADQELLRITVDTLSSQEGSYKLTKMSYDGGIATALDLRQAETSVDTARANLAQYTRQVAQDQNALVQLVGTALPADLPPGTGLDEQQLLADLPAGLPSDLLVRRPDILAAEHNLIAANASIGAARAAFFPSLTLTGNYGTASTQLSGLFDHGSTAWTFSPQISLPIFAAGANVASLNLAKVEKDINIVQYEQAIQTAFREVADALAGRGTLDSQIAADQALVEATSDSFKLSDKRFRDGVDDYLSVLDSQRSLYTAEQTLIGVKLARLQNLVTLYKALGGGWSERGAQNDKVTDSTHAVSGNNTTNVTPVISGLPTNPEIFQ